MRKAAYLFFFLILIAAVVVMIAGNPLSFFSPPGQDKPGNVDVGFILLDQPEESHRVSFEAVTTNIHLTGYDPEAAVQEKTADLVAETTFIQMIRGHDLDDTGNATSWIFVVRQPEQVSLVTFDRFGQKISQWEGSYPENPINISHIVTPGDLFSKNYQVIFPAPESRQTEVRELALAGDTYYLTMTGAGKTRNLIFDAQTGALVSSND
jgi:hypothetical protein